MIRRYICVDSQCMEDDPKGSWIGYYHYENLLKENERLKRELSYHRDDASRLRYSNTTGQ